MSETKFGTFDELMAQSKDVVQPIAQQLRKMVLGVDPEAVEVVRLGDRAATYGVGPSKTKEAFTYVMPNAKWVNLGFFRAGVLDDPAGLLEGTGANMRHVKVRSLEDAKAPALRKLVVAARKERIAALGLKSG